MFRFGYQEDHSGYRIWRINWRKFKKAIRVTEIRRGVCVCDVFKIHLTCLVECSNVLDCKLVSLKSGLSD